MQMLSLKLVRETFTCDSSLLVFEQCLSSVVNWEVETEVFLILVLTSRKPALQSYKLCLLTIQIMQCEMVFFFNKWQMYLLIVSGGATCWLCHSYIPLTDCPTWKRFEHIPLVHQKKPKQTNLIKLLFHLILTQQQ